MNSTLTVSELRKLLRDLLDRNHAGDLREWSLFSTGPPALRCLTFLLQEIYGTEGMFRKKVEQLEIQCAMFERSYGDGPVDILRVPARINILGEHIDYVSYLPTASLTLGSREHDMVLLFRASESGAVRGLSTLAGSDGLSVDLAEAPPPGAGGDWESYLYGRPAPPPHWGNYVKGAVFYACMRFGEVVRRGFDFVIDSTIPPAGGASSSSALTVLAGAALRDANRIAFDPAELARDSARAEWFIGTRGGSMDHTTMCIARQRHGVHISYAENRSELVPMNFPEVRWLTLFSHPADKSRQVMLEYNERAAVSRMIIPALIESWTGPAPGPHAAWTAAVQASRLGSVTALDELETLAGLLPAAITFLELEQRHPKASADCARAFPALLRDRRTKPVKVRDRALHHLGEVRRVAAAASALRTAAASRDPQQDESTLRLIGRLLLESHASLRDLYGVSTPAVEQLLNAVTSDPGVYGARLMGGGFGGNVLALTSATHTSRVVGRAQESYYQPQGRDSSTEHAIMVSTSGDGFSRLDCTRAARAAVTNLNTAWRDSERHREAVCRLLDELNGESGGPEIWPVIVAAGKGVRARASGIQIPKPLAPVAGMPAVLRVLEAIYANDFKPRRPVVVVSPETEQPLRELLRDTEACFVLQPRALGTGDAVLCAAGAMKGFTGRALVVWGTQPVIRAETVRRSLRLAAIHPEYSMVVPTALVEQPYAPLSRDSEGRVLGSRETHLEQAQSCDRGETNIGLFIAWSTEMFGALEHLKQMYWREREGRYDRRGGELGFPNELITHLAIRASGILAAPIADPREERGVKTLQDIAACETFIRELNRGRPTH